jgi:hypothetical protein
MPRGSPPVGVSSTPMELEPEQEDLLATLVEATRRVPRTERYFLTISALGTGDMIQGAGLEGSILAPASDIECLAGVGLLQITSRQAGSIGFVIAPAGFSFFEAYKRRSAEPAEQVEEDVRAYFDSEHFRSAYPTAHRLWSEAAESVWRAEAPNELTAIGHKAREAMQAFATELVQKHNPADVNADPTKTLDRVSAVIKVRAGQLGEAGTELMDGLFGYWRAVNSIVQRQEHGAQKEGKALTWEDGRRVVFHTIAVMTELDRGLQLEPSSAS